MLNFALFKVRFKVKFSRSENSKTRTYLVRLFSALGIKIDKMNITYYFKEIDLIVNLFLPQILKIYIYLSLPMIFL